MRANGYGSLPQALPSTGVAQVTMGVERSIHPAFPVSAVDEYEIFGIKVFYEYAY